MFWGRERRERERREREREREKEGGRGRKRGEREKRGEEIGHLPEQVLDELESSCPIDSSGSLNNLTSAELA